MTSTNPLDWEYHQVDHLFLLIGENPLPNYVAAKTLLREGGKPYLVYSEHTFEAYKRLKEVLDPKGLTVTEEEKVELWNNEANAFEIQKAIQDKVKQLKKHYPEKTVFGLNYTGGTKAMAVHAYQALLDPELKLSEEPRFSYLDSRTLKMMFDQKNNQPIPLDVPTEKLDITGETLFKLHGLYWKKGKKPINKPKLVEAAKELLTLYMNDKERNQFDSSWLKWCDKVLTPNTQKQNKYGRYVDWKNEEELENVSSLDFNVNLEIDDPEKPGKKKHQKIEAPDQIKNILIDYLGALSGNLSLTTAKERGSFEKLSHVCEWLSCGWLEHYVLDKIQEISHEPPLKDKTVKIEINPKITASAMSFNIIDKPDEEWEKFQFDVAFRRSYQLFAISCTTSRTTERCKEKLFEAYIRAKQLGGAEARVALVCFHSKPENIVKTFNSLIEDTKIAVFGHKHLKNLSRNIANWIDGKPY
jgi:hypothetical protein